MVQLLISVVCRDACDQKHTIDAHKTPEWEDLRVGTKLLWLDDDTPVEWTVVEVWPTKVKCTAVWGHADGKRYFHKEHQGDPSYWQLSDHQLVG